MYFTAPCDYFSVQKVIGFRSFYCIEKAVFLWRLQNPVIAEFEHGEVRQRCSALHQQAHHLLRGTSKSTGLAGHCKAAGAGHLHVMFLEKDTQPVTGDASSHPVYTLHYCSELSALHICLEMKLCFRLF
jgi:hypothetical protein